MIGITSTLSGNGELIFSADGKVRMKALAHAALTAKTPYRIIWNEYGPVTTTIADDVHYFYVCVPEKDIDSGEVAELQIGGLVEDMITPSLSMEVGHAFKIFDGAVADVGSDYSGAAGEFGVAVTATAVASTTQDCFLVPIQIIGTT